MGSARGEFRSPWRTQPPSVREDLGSTRHAHSCISRQGRTDSLPPWRTACSGKRHRVTFLSPAPKPQPFPRPTGHRPWIRVQWVEQSRDWERGPERVSHQSRSHSPPDAWERTGLGAFGTAHRRLLPPQFLRNSLKKTRGSNWSLRLSKELNNQIESFDSPSLEKVCPRGVGTVQTGRGLQGWWSGGSCCG